MIKIELNVLSSEFLEIRHILFRYHHIRVLFNFSLDFEAPRHISTESEYAG